MKPFLPTLLAVATAFTVTACSGNKGTTAETPTTEPPRSATEKSKAYDPCQLITQADIEQAYGWTVKLKDNTNKPANVVGQRICNYVTAPGSAAPEFFMIQIDVTSEASMGAGPRQGGVTATSQYENIKQAFTTQGITEVPGIGDKAWDGGCKLGPGGLHVLVQEKGVYFTITSMSSGKPCETEQAIWKNLAQILIDRL